MAKSILQAGLKLLATLGRLLAPAPGGGWRRSTRGATDLRTR